MSQSAIYFGDDPVNGHGRAPPAAGLARAQLFVNLDATNERRRRTQAARM